MVSAKRFLMTILAQLMLVMQAVVRFIKGSKPATAMETPVNETMIPAPEPTITPEQTEAKRKADIAERQAAARRRRQAKLAERELAIKAAEVAAFEERARAEKLEQTLREIDASVRKGHEPLEKAGDTLTFDEAIMSATCHLDAAIAAHRTAVTLTDRQGLYSPIKELERAIAKTKARQQDETDRRTQEAADKAAAAKAEALARAQAEACAKRAEEEAKQAVLQTRETAKILTARFQLDVRQVRNHIANGAIGLAKDGLKAVKLLRHEANKARRDASRTRKTELREISPFEITRLEQELNVKETEIRQAEAIMAAKQAKLDENRSWLERFFGTKIDRDGKLMIEEGKTYKARPDSNRRCAVCLAQAKRVIKSLDNPQGLVTAYVAMRNHLKRGLDEFGAQLCDHDAQQALDVAGRAHGHRFFERRMQMIDSLVDHKTGEISAEKLEQLESAMAAEASKPDFQARFDVYINDRVVLSSRKKPNPMVRLAYEQKKADAAEAQAA